MRGGDNCSFENTWERAINERIIYQLSNRRKEYIQTILKEECWYGVQWARFSRRLIDALTDLVFSYRLKGIESMGHRIRCIVERARSRKCVPDFAYFLGEEKSKCVSKAFFLSYEPAEESHRCDAIPSSMTATASWGPHYLRIRLV